MGGEIVKKYSGRTSRSGYRYGFPSYHYGHGGNRKKGTWAADVTRDEEFQIFDAADRMALADQEGKLYGMRVRRNGVVLPLGTLGEQLARFEDSGPSQVWHGYPFYPLSEPSPSGPPRRAMPEEVLSRMEELGLIDAYERRRLKKRRQI
jgi:hypothetical protein